VYYLNNTDISSTHTLFLQLYNLKETFSRLKALAEVKDLSTRIRFMIQALVELRSNNWTPRHINTVNGNKIENKNSSSDRANHRKFFYAFIDQYIVLRK